jgi:pyruvate dehydrogenase E2 component (dihydrolipoamide acetyltransferase)
MATRIIMPQGGQDITEGWIVRWMKAEGELVHKGEVICEVETEKAVFEVESPVDGVLLKIVAPAGAKVPIFSLIGIVGEPGETVSEDVRPVEEPSGGRLPDAGEIRRRLAQGGPKAEPIKVTGRARKLADEKGIDLQAVVGTGPQGRVIEKDVLLHMEKRRISVAALRGRSEPLTRMRQAIARRVLHSKQTVPHFYVTVAVDMTAALTLRESLRSGGAGISVTDWIVKASALALRAFPRVNSRIQEDRLVVFEDVNIGIAVNVESGLVVPVLARADALSLEEIARRSGELVAAAQAGRQLGSDSGTFTVSNLGMLGVDSFIAIINPPEVAILAVGAVRKQPVVSAEGLIHARDMLNMTLSADHRIIDGALAARFINCVKDALENPRGLIGPS